MTRLIGTTQQTVITRLRLRGLLARAPSEPPIFQRILWDSYAGESGNERYPTAGGDTGRSVDADPHLGGPFQVWWNIGPNPSIAYRSAQWLLGNQLGVLLTEDRPNWGWGAKEPVPMFTEAEIRAACKGFGLLDTDTDLVIEQLKGNRQRIRAAGSESGGGGPPERDAD
jgi:hypothetical protein